MPALPSLGVPTVLYQFSGAADPAVLVAVGLAATSAAALFVEIELEALGDRLETQASVELVRTCSMPA
jgi:hypothetical protein